MDSIYEGYLVISLYIHKYAMLYYCKPILCCKMLKGPPIVKIKRPNLC